MAFVGSDLEHRVDGGVADGLAGADAFLAQLGDDGGTRGVLVAQNPRQLGAFNEFSNQVGRKGRFGLREIAPVEGNWDAADFPMTGRCILAIGNFTANAKAPALGLRR
ncbi:hypothetical protein D9M68_954710 [compost metagenome]